MHARLLSLFCDPAAAPLLAGACPGGRFSPARLFKAVYCSNLLRNGEFLERTNSTRARGAGGGARSVTWVSAPGGFAGRGAAVVVALVARAAACTPRRGMRRRGRPTSCAAHVTR